MYTAASEDEFKALALLISADINKNRFQSILRRLYVLFDVYSSTCPAPLPAPGLIVTPDIRSQCERYLPINEITSAFNHLYSAALNYQPILSSTPFHNSMSWADAFAELSAEFQFSANPALLLEALLDDNDMRRRFICASFLPGRFYGGIGRYPEQQQFIRDWLATRKAGRLHCLDAACGIGEDSYGLAIFLKECGFSPEEILIEGWTLEPLEVWAAEHRCLPHDRCRQELFRKETSKLLEQEFRERICFRCVDLTDIKPSTVCGQFDLILCNGLLGGPIIHSKDLLELTVSNLAHLLAPGGVLLAADSFHGGWKQQCPQKNLQALLEKCGLNSFEVGGGVGGLKSD